MLPAVAQTLANFLVKGTSLTSTHCIDFHPPGQHLSGQPGFNLYCYSLSERAYTPPGVSLEDARLCDVHWFDVSFLISARDYTFLGKHQLLSEALSALLHQPYLKENLLAPELRGHGDLSFSILPSQIIQPAVLWRSLGVPIQPALYVTVVVPFPQVASLAVA
jgi:hypothetical protein